MTRKIKKILAYFVLILAFVLMVLGTFMDVKILWPLGLLLFGATTMVIYRDAANERIKMEKKYQKILGWALTNEKYFPHRNYPKIYLISGAIIFAIGLLEIFWLLLT